MQRWGKDFRKKGWFILSSVCVRAALSSLTSATLFIVSNVKMPLSSSYFLKNTHQYLLDNPLNKPPIVCWNAFLLHHWFYLSAWVPPHSCTQPPCLLHHGCCFSFKWTVGFFYFLQVLDSPYRPHSFGGCQLVLSTDVSFLMLPFFFLQRERTSPSTSLSGVED